MSGHTITSFDAMMKVAFDKAMALYRDELVFGPYIYSSYTSRAVNWLGDEDLDDLDDEPEETTEPEVILPAFCSRCKEPFPYEAPPDGRCWTCRGKP